MTRNLLVFSSTNYKRNNKKLFDNTYKKYFDNIILYNENDLDNNIKNIVNNIINKYGPCGYGYWIWKPYLILQELNKMQTNDILFYIDSHFYIRNENLIERITNDLIKEQKAVFSGNKCGSDDYYWTTMKLRKCIEHKLHYKFSINELKEEHNDAGLLFIKKNNFSMMFFRKMFDIMLNNIEYVSNNHNRDNDNVHGFQENRHDQSVFNLMIKYYKVKTPQYILYGEWI